MLDLIIDYFSDTKLSLIDNSDYTGLTVASTKLRIFSYPITSGVYTTAPLYPENVGSVGDDVVLDLLEDLDAPYKATDGVYRFDYIVTLDDESTVEQTIYYIKDVNLKVCKRKLLRAIINNKKVCKSCEATHFDATLNTAQDEIEKENYKEAEYFIEYLKEICSICNC